MEDLLLHLAARERVLQHARIHLLVEPRHGEHERRPDGLHVDRHRVDRLGVRDGNAVVHHHVVTRHALEDMRERQEAQPDVVAREGDRLGRGHHVGEDIVVREHDSLRLARRARGVNQRQKIVGPHRVGARSVFRASCLVIPSGAQGFELRDRVIGAHVPLAGKRDHVPQRRAATAYLRELLALRRIADEDDDRPGVADDVRCLLGRQIRIERDVDQPAGHAGKVGDRPLGPVLRENGDALTGMRAEFGESEREMANAVGESAAGDRLVDAVHFHLQRVRLVEPRDRVEEQLNERAWRALARSTGRDHRDSNG